MAYVAGSPTLPVFFRPQKNKFIVFGVVRMRQDKVVITKKHLDAIKKAVKVFGSQAALARYLDIESANISAWIRGCQVIPFPHAERISSYSSLMPTVLELRPDIAKYRKYLV